MRRGPRLPGANPGDHKGRAGDHKGRSYGSTVDMTQVPVRAGTSPAPTGLLVDCYGIFHAHFPFPVVDPPAEIGHQFGVLIH